MAAKETNNAIKGNFYDILTDSDYSFLNRCYRHVICFLSLKRKFTEYE